MSEETETLGFVWTQLVYALPVSLAYLAGCVAAWLQRKKHTRSAKLVGLACLLGLALNCLGPVAAYLLNKLTVSTGFQLIPILVSGGWAVIKATIISLLLLAAFVDRSKLNRCDKGGRP
jgi:hypothetical protein